MFILKRAVIFAALFVCAGLAAAQEVTFHSRDDAVVLTGRFVSFDGQIATIVGEDGLVSFRADGMDCKGDTCPDLDIYVPRLKMVGAPRMAQMLLPALIDVYARDNQWTVHEDAGAFEMVQSDGVVRFRIELTAADAEDAFVAFKEQREDVLLSTRELRPVEIEEGFRAGLGRLNTARQARIVALDALVPVISPKADIRSITLTDLTQALSGESDVFDVHLPTDLGGQIEGFQDRFMAPSELSFSVTATVHADRASLVRAVESGVRSLSLLPFGSTGNAQPLALSGPCGLSSVARFLTMKTEDYPLTFPMFMYLPQRNQHPQIEDFLGWLRSPSAQLVIRRAGFVDLAAIPIPLSNQGDRLANAIANAGAEVSLGELQRMVRLLQSRVRMSSTFRFEQGSTRLDGQSRSNVMQLAQAIRDGRFGGRELMFVGFSDGRGPAAANQALSAARAEAVRADVERALGENIPSNVLIQTAAFGEALPMACDDAIWGQQTNRRVELWVRDAS